MLSGRSEVIRAIVMEDSPCCQDDPRGHVRPVQPGGSENSPAHPPCVCPTVDGDDL